jgi:thiamine biosynthesis lipoprotein
MRGLVALSVAICCIPTEASPALRRFEAVEPHMGTLVRVTLYASNEQSANHAFRAAFGRIAELDRILSDYRPDSELNRFSKHAGNSPTRVSHDLFVVLQASQRLALQTDGAFDITLGPVIRLWREARREGRLPEPSALTDAANRSGFRKLHLNPGLRTATLEVPGMMLDVGAIGKGYAASESVATLKRLGIRSALVAVSGDIACSDAPPGERGWRVGIRSGADVPADARTIELTNAAVSTSGSSEQHLDVGGRRYSHIIDPASRMGLADDLTVTVVARHGIDADGLDTAVSVLGAERGLALVESWPDAAALVVERRAAGARVLTSSRFPTFSAASPARR